MRQEDKGTWKESDRKKEGEIEIETERERKIPIKEP